MALVVVGGQWGDEGKGKIVAYLALKDKPHIIARAGVGPNAGHTVEYKGRKYGLRLTPSGFVYEKARLLVGAGVLVDPRVFLSEVKEFGVGGRISVDMRCGIIEQEHIERDRGSKHLSSGIGSTGTGCGPANMDRAQRTLKLAKDVAELKPYLADVAAEVNSALDKGQRVMVEGSQGFGLSLLYGTYPYVTSKDTTASAAAMDVGIGPKKIKDVMVIFKSYPSRVGSGPFPTELSEEEANRLGIEEYGTVTGRKRRTGSFDFEAAKYAVMLNSASQVALTCLDYIDKGCSGATSYKGLSKKCRAFVEKVERELGAPVTLISTGPGIDEIIDMRGEKL